MGKLTHKAAEDSVCASKREAKELATMQEENEQQRKKICTLHAERDESELLAICQMTDLLEEKADIAHALETQCMKLNDAEAGRQVVQEKLRDTEEQLARKNDIIDVHLTKNFMDHTTAASSGGTSRLHVLRTVIVQPLWKTHPLWICGATMTAFPQKAALTMSMRRWSKDESLGLLTAWRAALRGARTEACPQEGLHVFSKYIQQLCHTRLTKKVQQRAAVESEMVTCHEFVMNLS